MSLFESQHGRNERLIGKAVEKAYQKVYDEFGDDTQEMTRYAAWFGGAALAALLILDESSELKKHWGKGDEHKAERVIEVFTLGMVSRWYRFLETRGVPEWDPSEDTRRQAREISATNLLGFCSRFSAQALDEFMKLDVQYNFDRDKIESDEHGTSYIELDLLCWRAAIACGSPIDISLSKVTFPLSSYVDTVAEGIPGWHPIERMSVNMAMFEGFKRMLELASEGWGWKRTR